MSRMVLSCSAVLVLKQLLSRGAVPSFPGSCVGTHCLVGSRLPLRSVKNRRSLEDSAFPGEDPGNEGKSEYEQRLSA